MRCLAINKRTIWYATYKSYAETSSSGIYSREKVVSYNMPVQMKINFSPANGLVALEGNGISSDYTHVMVTDNMSCPIDTDTLIWVDRTPTITGQTFTKDADYRVTYVSRSLNHIKYGLREIKNG